VRRIAAAAVALMATAARAETWEASASPDSRVVVHVFKRGLLSGFAHDHHFEVTDWRATASAPGPEPESAKVEVVLSAGSLRDRQDQLSEEDRRKVNSQAAGPEVLDAEHHPRIEFRSERFEIEPGGPAGHVKGALHGTLTLRGRSAPAVVDLDLERIPGGWRVRGGSRVKQSAFGIAPFSGFGGTVGVKDELEIELSLVARLRG
jgi:polyisoprenoid-binding protein YceI